MLADTDQSIEIRVLSAAVTFDGEIVAEVRVADYEEPVQLAFDAPAHVALTATWEEQRAIDLDGRTATDRRLLEVLNRHLARLSRELKRARRTEARLWRERQERGAEAF